MTPFSPNLQMMNAPRSSRARMRVGSLRLGRFALDSRAHMRALRSKLSKLSRLEARLVR